jgi:hypothetical protein
MGTIAALLFLCTPVFGQMVHYVFLQPKPITIQSREFYISDIIDDRIDTTNIGIVYIGPFKAHHRAVFTQNCSTALKRFFNKSLPESEGQMPIVLRINKLRVEERVAMPIQNGWVDLNLAFYYKGRLVFQTVEHQVSVAKDVTKQHSENIAVALENAVLEFSQSPWKGRAGMVGPDGSQLPVDNSGSEEASVGKK